MTRLTSPVSHGQWTDRQMAMLLGVLSLMVVAGIGSVETVPTNLPEVAISPKVTIGYEQANLSIVIYCDFNGGTHQNLFYQIRWYVNNMHVHSSEIHSWSPSYRKTTALYQSMLVSRGIHKMGFDTRCEVITRVSADSTPVSSYTSLTKFLGITTDDWFFSLRNGEVRTIRFRSTAPIVCWAGIAGQCELVTAVEVVSHTNPDCQSDVYTISSCAVTFTPPFPSSQPNPGDWNFTSTDMKVRGHVVRNRVSRTAVTKFRVTTSMHHDMQFWRNVYVGELNVQVISTPDVADGRECRIFFNKHVLTFDGRLYKHRISGVFTVYKHQQLPVEIQMIITPCTRHRSATCGQAVAVRSGQSVFRIVRWSVSQPWQIGFASCERDALAVKMKEKMYMVYLPTGGYVKIKLRHESLVASIFPSSEDVNRTEGLCGTLTGSCTDDFVLRNGSMDHSSDATKPRTPPGLSDTFSDFSESWRVSVNKNLFRDENLDQLSPWGKSYQFCTCQGNGTPDKNTSTCSTGVRQNCKHKLYVGLTDINCSTRQGKRRSPRASSRQKRESLPKSDTTPDGHWDKARAREHCKRLFKQSEAIKNCTGINETNLQSYLDLCINYTQQIKSNIDPTAVNASKSSCILAAILNADVEDDTELGTGTSLGQGQNSLCPGNCNNRGVCKYGKCHCLGYYGGKECSFKVSNPPTALTVKKDSEEIVVTTEDAIDSSDVKCWVQSFTIDEQNTESRETPVTQTPRVESPNEAVCRITVNREKRDVSDTPTMVVARGYRVSLANDGVTFSSDSIFIAFNSQCQRCRITDDVISCEFVIPACIYNNKCVRAGEMHPTIPCYKCSEDKPGVWTRSTEGECPKKTPGSLLWVLGAVVGAVVLSAVTVVAVAWRLNRKKEKTVA